MGMTYSDYVVTEAGFGADLGAEKFLNIKCRYGNISPAAVVMVATIRALKYHGGQPRAELTAHNTVALVKGLANLEQHVNNMAVFKLPVVVALNHFSSDTEEEVQILSEWCERQGVKMAVCAGWASGGAGAEELAQLVSDTVDANKTVGFKPVYEWDWSVKEKIEAIARKIYGAKDIEYLPKAKQNLHKLERIGLAKRPVCIAKTQNSFSDDPKALGRPENFTVTVREIEIAAGAGYAIPIMGNMLRMPGLPSTPAATGMDIDNDGVITGLS